LRKAVLLEGSPGVGKTSLVAALARAARQPLVRINLSEQTDMMDLLGADLPAPGGAPGQFAWCDGPLLGALRAGHWVLLDELNLAGQSVLEGLNALLDHRSEVFIPELGATFRCHPRFRLFAAQNPVGEGGGRKGLPRSFLNRFTRVAVELLRREDLLFIAGALHPRVPPPLRARMVGLLDAMAAAAAGGGGGGGGGQPAAAAAAGVRDFAAAGGPWEFNLRDLLRWCDLVEGAVPPPPPAAPAALDAVAAAMETDGGVGAGGAGDADGDGGEAGGEAAALDDAAQHFARMLFAHRLRTHEDRAKLLRLFAAVWGCSPAAAWAQQPPVLLSPRAAVVGRATLPRAADPTPSASGGAASTSAAAAELQLLPAQLPPLESLLQALSRGWMALLVGGAGAGKTALARCAAALVGERLLEISLTSGTDTSDLLGSFEQLEPESIFTMDINNSGGLAERSLAALPSSILTSIQALLGPSSSSAIMLAL
ncbi:Midasin, partial [Tetrabaena socialis]